MTWRLIFGLKIDQFKINYGEKTVKLVRDLALAMLVLGAIISLLVLLNWGLTTNSSGINEIYWPGVAATVQILLSTIFFYCLLTFLVVVAENLEGVRKAMNHSTD